MTVRILTDPQRRLYQAGLPVACFGKLPIYKDFVRVDGGSDDLRAFIEWMDRAFGMRWDDLDGRGEILERPMRMLMAPPRRGSAAVVAAIRDSSDEGGLRRFPFAVFCAIPARVIDAGSPAFVTGLVPVWEALEELADEASRTESIDAFYEAFRGRSIVPDLPDESEPQLTERLTMSLFARSLDQDHLGVSLPGLLFEVARSVRRLKKGDGATVFRIPLASSRPAAGQAGAWAGILARNSSRLAALPTVVLPKSGYEAAPAFALVYRPLTEADARLLTPRADRAERIADLAAERVRRLSPPPKFTDRLRKDLLDREATLEDLAAYKLPKAKSADMEWEDSA